MTYHFALSQNDSECIYTIIMYLGDSRTNVFFEGDVPCIHYRQGET